MWKAAANEGRRETSNTGANMIIMPQPVCQMSCGGSAKEAGLNRNMVHATKLEEIAAKK